MVRTPVQRVRDCWCEAFGSLMIKVLALVWIGVHLMGSCPLVHELTGLYLIYLINDKIQREVSTVLHRKNDNQKAIIGSSKSVLVQYSHDSYHSIFTPVYEGRIPLTYFDDPQHVQMILHGHLNGIECIEVSTMV